MRDKKINMVFDLDDTLYDLMEPFRKAHEKIFAGRVTADCAELFNSSRVYSDKILDMEKKGQVHKEDSFYKRLYMTYKDAGLEPERSECDLFEREYRHYQTVIERFPFVDRVLDFCKEEGIPMAILTNGTGKGQRRKAEALGLGRWFSREQIYVTGEIGFHKPDVHAFRAVEERAGFLPEHTWYIGDTYESDVAGAAEAGWHAVWFNHRKRGCPEVPSRAEEVVERGEELLPLLWHMAAGL